jgi:putative transposase
MRYLSTGHAVFKLCYHLVIITKYRRKILTPEMIEDIRELITNVLSKNSCNLLEINGEADHVHILFETLPTTELTKLINCIKTVSSRILRKKYQLQSLKRNKNVLWSPSYFIASCGEVKIETLRKYIENQGNIFTPPKQSLEGSCT